MARRIQITVGVLLVAAVVFVFYRTFFSNRPSVSRAAVNVNTSATVVRHPLTGEPVTSAQSFFSVSVMYDNFSDVKNHPGLEDASIVYEALAEGNITRWMAIFDSTKKVEKVGPIRSIRPYFIDWAEEYGGMIMHVGGSPAALARLPKSPLIDLNQIGSNEVYFYRGDTTKPPHNVFTSYSSWLRAADRVPIPPFSITPWSYTTAPTAAATTSPTFMINYAPDYQVGWVYDSQPAKYLRFHNSERAYYDSGHQLQAANIVIIEVPSKIIDTVGRRSMETIGSGKLRIYSGGEITTGSWSKASPTSRIQFFDSNGQPIALHPGVTWVEAVPSLDMVSEKL